MAPGAYQRTASRPPPLARPALIGQRHITKSGPITPIKRQVPKSCSDLVRANPHLQQPWPTRAATRRDLDPTWEPISMDEASAMAAPSPGMQTQIGILYPSARSRKWLTRSKPFDPSSGSKRLVTGDGTGQQT
ncbi:hypothetical protein ACLOJK_014916 [Asimina triloba]